MLRFVRGKNPELVKQVCGSAPIKKEPHERFFLFGPGGSRTHGRQGLGNLRSILLSYRAKLYLIISWKRLRSKNLLAFAFANATPFFSTPPRSLMLTRLAHSPRRTGPELQSQALFNYIMKTAPLETSLEFLNSLCFQERGMFGAIFYFITNFLFLVKSG